MNDGRGNLISSLRSDFCSLGHFRDSFVEGGGTVNQISEGRKLVKDGEIVRVCVDDDTHLGLPICLVESHSRNQG